MNNFDLNNLWPFGLTRTLLDLSVHLSSNSPSFSSPFTSVSVSQGTSCPYLFLTLVRNTSPKQSFLHLIPAWYLLLIKCPNQSTSFFFFLRATRWIYQLYERPLGKCTRWKWCFLGFGSEEGNCLLLRERLWGWYNSLKLDSDHSWQLWIYQISKLYSSKV